jgi:hypothetical protein
LPELQQSIKTDYPSKLKAKKDMQTQPILQILSGNIAISKDSNNIVDFHHVDVTPKLIKRQNIYPQQRKLILDNYRRYTQYYRELSVIRNKEVKDYNSVVATNTAKHNKEDLAKREIAAFTSEMGRVSIEEYNTAVEIRNNQNGEPLISKKRYMPVPKSYEHTFSMIVFKYAMQIQEKNNILQSVGATTLRALQKVKINPYELCNTVINDVNTLPYSKRTMQNHVLRLVEAGVLFAHEYKGYFHHKDPKMRAGKPSEYHVNSDILVIYDDEKRKTLTSQNQLFTFSIEKKLRYNVIVTRTYKDKTNINEIVSNQFQHKEKTSRSSTFLKVARSPKVEHNKNYKNTNAPKEDKKQTGAEIFNEYSEKLRELTPEKHELIDDLANKVYDKHRFKLQQRLEYELSNGNLSKIEYLDLLVAQFMMLVAPMYQDKEVFSGSWFNSYEDIRDLFLNSNGTIPGKVNLLNTFASLHWRINYAKKYYRSKKEVRPLFPSQYFEPYRKTSKSGGFAYTLNFWKNQQEYHANAHIRKQKQIGEAKIRNQRYQMIELVEKQIRQVVNGTKTVTQLHNFVTTNKNIPADVKLKVPQYLEKAYKTYKC